MLEDHLLNFWFLSLILFTTECSHILRMPRGNFFKFGTNVHLDSRMQYFDSAGKGHCDVIMSHSCECDTSRVFNNVVIIMVRLT